MGQIIRSKILFVDDEPSILEAFKRQLRGNFDIHIATSGKIGTTMLKKHAQFAVVVSDMRMPEMDGVEFLNKVKQSAPDAVRIMLTGNADQESAVRAVNEGNIFRFLNKPCSTDDLMNVLNDAVRQHQLIVAEKELLQNTLSGSVKLLTEILSFSDPDSFGQSLKLRQLVQKVVPTLRLSNSWEIELAAMLSNIGAVTIPSTVNAKLRRGVVLSLQEQELIDKVPMIGQSLLANIPRLEGVGGIVLYQNKHFGGSGSPSDEVKGKEIPLGARIIKILKDFILLQAEGSSDTAIIEKMARRKGWYDPDILASISGLFGAT